MPQYRPTDGDYVRVEHEGAQRTALRHEVFESFSPAILGLGEVAQPSRPVHAVCAILDLEGFTGFCQQREPERVVPPFLHDFLEWAFRAVRRECSRAVVDGAHVIWHDLPYVAKFLGDGLMFLWDTDEMTLVGQNNLMVSMSEITQRYRTEFLPTLSGRVPAAPETLRCGMAKGTVYTVGDGGDCVGPSINLAARLQKLPGASVVVAQRGFDPERHLRKAAPGTWSLRHVRVRGLGAPEPVLVPRADLERMTADERALYLEP